MPITCKTRIILFFLLLFLAMTSGLPGCATSKAENQFGPMIESPSPRFESPGFRRNEPLEPLPEMTAGEYERLGNIAFARNELANAYMQYEKSLEKKPGNLRVMHKKGMTLLKGNLNQHAVEAFTKLVETAPDYASGHEGLGMALFMEKSLDEAHSAFSRAVTLDPKLWKSHNYIGIISDIRGDYDQAAEAYARAVEAAPRERTIQMALHNNLGYSHYMSGNYEAAENIFRESIEKGFRSDRIYNNLGRTLGKTGNYEQALAAFMKAGNRAQAYNNIGVIYLDEGRYDDAIASFKKAIVARPEYYATAGENLKHAREARQDRANRSNMDNTGFDIPINPEE